MAPYIDAWFALSLVIFGLSHAAQPRLGPSSSTR